MKKKTIENKIKVVELFAGVGGFRIGLEGWQGKSASSKYLKPIDSPYQIIWSNQWEPATKAQHASLVYENKFGKNNHSNQDIATVHVDDIPNHDLLVGGFPCQDYSVATTLKNSKGLIGKKGVLWWSIHEILSGKENKPNYLFLENVDRLLKSPANQRGRDFAIILQSLNELGYIVEWRVINASDYGMPQKRRRTFILAYHKKSPVYKSLLKSDLMNWLLKVGTIAEAFPVFSEGFLSPSTFNLPNDIVDISENFNKNGEFSLFENTGIMIKGIVATIKTVPKFNGNFAVLGDIISNKEVTDNFFIDEKDFNKWLYLKGAKKEIRKNSQGFEYNYSEGGMPFPDSLDKPSRTIVTGEGGSSASRFKHVIKTPKGYRRLTPTELERLNMFPDNHTKLNGVSDAKRAFFMGNALVVGVIEKIGIALKEKIQNETIIQSER